jgi:glycosyltransferase involved in cell wall biosynthesis
VSVTVCIPTIPTRSQFLRERALPSVYGQTRPADAIAISSDLHKEGAWTNRDRALKMAQTDWVAFLDDDDELLPHHLELLLATAEQHHADVVWGWFTVIGGSDPFPQHQGRQWDINDPHIFPITALVRRELIVESGAHFHPDHDNGGNWGAQDFPFWKAIHDVGGKFFGIPDVTWNWHHHGANTSGLPTRW